MKQWSAEKIETLVRERQTREALLGIRHYAKKGPRDPDRSFQACDWLRRLGHFREAFLLLSPSEPLRRGTSTATLEGKRVLWAARLLNAMGATEFAIHLIDGLQAESSEDHRILGNVYLVHFDFTEALKHFLEMNRLDQDRSTYASQISQVSLADAYAGCGDLDTAIGIVHEVSASRPEAMLRFVALSAKGEYLARSGQFRKARSALALASDLMPAHDKSPDAAVLMKWRGYVSGMQGDHQSASADFRVAERILRRSSYRPEAWIDVLRLKLELGMLPARKRDLLGHYPGLAPEMRKRLGTSDAPLWIGSPRSDLCLMPSSNEFVVKGRTSLGIPLELRLLAYLLQASGWGLGRVRAQTVLWPDEVYSFTQLDERLNKLIQRLRKKYHIGVQVDQNNIKLQSSDLRIASCLASSEPLPPLLLRECPIFSSKHLQARYGLSRTQAASILQEWIENDWIEKDGKGPKTFYRSRKVNVPSL